MRSPRSVEAAELGTYAAVMLEFSQWCVVNERNFRLELANFARRRMDLPPLTWLEADRKHKRRRRRKTKGRR